MSNPVLKMIREHRDITGKFDEHHVEALCIVVERQDALLEQVMSALRACEYELVTLNPRLTPMFQKSVLECIAMAKAAIKAAEMKS
jgi:hypothetical protein